MYFGSSSTEENFNITPKNAINISHSQKNTEKKELSPVDETITKIAKPTINKNESSYLNLQNNKISHLNNSPSSSEEKIKFLIQTEKLNSLNESDVFEEVLDDIENINIKEMFLIQPQEKKLNNFNKDFDEFFNDDNDNPNDNDTLNYVESNFFTETDGSADVIENNEIDPSEFFNENDENLIKELKGADYSISRNINNFQSEENSTENLESQKLEKKTQVNQEKTKTSENIQKNTEISEKTFADLHIESFASITKILKEKDIQSNPNALKNKFDSTFLSNTIQTQKQHLKLLKLFLKESAVEGLLTKNNQPLTKEETADLYRSLKKSFIELYVANPHLFLNQPQKKEKKQEVAHDDTLHSRSRQKAELYVYEPIDITKEINGKNSTSKKIHLLAVDLHHAAKIESKKEIKKKFIKEKNIDEQFLKRNEFKNMATELMIKENILKNIHLTSQLSRTAFKPAAPSA